MDVFNTYDNLNFFINRKKPYNPVGRNQTEEEAKEIDERIKTFCQQHDISYLIKDGTELGYIDIVDITLKYIKDNAEVEKLEEQFALEYSD